MGNADKIFSMISYINTVQVNVLIKRWSLLHLIGKKLHSLMRL